MTQIASMCLVLTEDLDPNRMIFLLSDTSLCNYVEFKLFH